MTLTAQILSPLYTSNLYTLHIQRNKASTDLDMQLFLPVVTTRYIPRTYSILVQELPKVLRTTCYNYENLPFHEEVRQTEIGHLFEHVLLTYLCKMKFASGTLNPVYEGITSWNWVEEVRGRFHIKINAGIPDEHLLTLAIKKSIQLINKILSSADIASENKSLSATLTA